MLVNISMKFHEDFLNRADTILSLKLLLKSSKGHNSKNIYRSRFLESAHSLMLVNISMMFHEDILNGFQVIERTALYYVLGIAVFHKLSYANRAIIGHTT